MVVALSRETLAERRGLDPQTRFSQVPNAFQASPLPKRFPLQKLDIDLGVDR